MPLPLSSRRKRVLLALLRTSGGLRRSIVWAPPIVQGCSDECLPDRQGVRRRHPAGLRPAHGSADVRALCAGPCRSGGRACAAAGAGNRCRNRRPDPRTGQRPARTGRPSWRPTSIRRCWSRPGPAGPTGRSTGGRPTAWRCRSPTTRSISSSASSESCSSPTSRAGSARRVACCVTGGHLLFNTWDRVERNAFAATVLRALGSIFPTDPPTFLARVPHGYHDTEAIRADLRGGGFGSPASITTLSFPTIARRHALQRWPFARARPCALRSRRATRRAWSAPRTPVRRHWPRSLARAR